MTEQRRMIARVLADSADHPDVEELYRRCAKIDEHISISTVYRTVKLFEDSGIIERHDFRDGRARYEQMTEAHHDHLINLRTGEVIEFQSEEIERLQAEVARKLGYNWSITGSSFTRCRWTTTRSADAASGRRPVGFCARHAAADAAAMGSRSRSSVRCGGAFRSLYHRFVCRLLGVRVHMTGAPARQAPAADRRQSFLLARHHDHHVARAGGVRGEKRDRALAVLRPARQAPAHACSSSATDVRKPAR